MFRLLTALAAIAFTAVPAYSQSQIRFAAGSDSGVWAGYVSKGEKKFALGMAKGQRLWLRSDQLYTWTVITPSGRELGCHGGSYCVPNDEKGVLLPESGSYTVLTTFRMGGGVNTQSSPQRYVAVTFTVR